MVPIEALASGAACIASNIEGHREVLNGGKAGLLLPCGDDTVWADALAALLDDPERLTALQASGRKCAEISFSWSRLLASYKAVYRQAVG